MGFLQAIILAIVQGATEFLPVSSSGHLRLMAALLGWDELPPEYFDYVIVLHFATLVAVVAYYRWDLVAIARGIFFPASEKEAASLPGNTSPRYLALLIIISALPAGVVGFRWKDSIKALFDEAGVAPVGVALLITAAALFIADRMKGKLAPDRLAWYDALLIGVAQAVAIMPGISRSGATIAAGLWRGLSQQWAPRFAFLMSIPPIAGAFGMALADLRGGDWAAQWPCYLCGFVVSAVVGYGSIYAVIRTVQQGRLFVRFGIYCLVLGSASLVAGWIGWV